jgi:hypothetical protein
MVESWQDEYALLMRLHESARVSVGASTSSSAAAAARALKRTIVEIPSLPHCAARFRVARILLEMLQRKP